VNYVADGQVLLVDQREKIELLLLVDLVVSTGSFLAKVHGLGKEGRTLNNR
jgi:hypothetical protein